MAVGGCGDSGDSTSQTEKPEGPTTEAGGVGASNPAGGNGGLASSPTSNPAGGNGGLARPGTVDLPAQKAFLAKHDLVGKVAMIQFGAVGCELSGQGFDRMMALHREKAIDGLSYVRVETSREAEAVEAYYAAKAPLFPVLRDPDSTLSRAFGATATPSLVLVGKFGHMRFLGRFPKRTLDDWVAFLVAEKTDPGGEVAMLGQVKLDGPRLLASTKLPDLGGVVRTLGDFSGSGGLVAVFVDTTCPESGTAMSQVPTVAQTLAKWKIPTVLVNLDDAKEKVADFYTGRKTGAPVVYDDTTGTKLQWGVQSVPTVMYLSPTGEVVYNGQAVWAKLAVAVNTVVGGPEGGVKFKAKGTEFG